MDPTEAAAPPDRKGVPALPDQGPAGLDRGPRGGSRSVGVFRVFMETTKCVGKVKAEAAGREWRPEAETLE